MKLKEPDQDSPLLKGQAAERIFLPGEVVIGQFAGLNDQGSVLVDYPENPSNQPLIAISTVELTQNQSGRQVAMLFAEGDPEKPVIIGLIHSPLYQMIENFEMTPAETEDPEENQNKKKAPGSTSLEDVFLDGKRVVLEGREEIVLKCGDASITLTKAGKILIRGKYLLARSTGVNRIMGGSVQVN